MDSSPPSWPSRLLRAIVVEEWMVWLGLTLLMVFLLGLWAGLTWCLHTQPQEVQRLSVQHQLDALDKRLRALEPQ